MGPLRKSSTSIRSHEASSSSASAWRAGAPNVLNPLQYNPMMLGSMMGPVWQQMAAANFPALNPQFHSMGQMMQMYGHMGPQTAQTPTSRKPLLSLANGGVGDGLHADASPADESHKETPPPECETKPLTPLSPAEQAKNMMDAWRARDEDKKKAKQQNDDDIDTDGAQVMRRPSAKRPTTKPKAKATSNVMKKPTTKPNGNVMKKPTAKMTPKSKPTQRVDVSKLTWGARLKLRPSGCSKCRFKPGCCESCFR